MEKYITSEEYCELMAQYPVPIETPIDKLVCETNGIMLPTGIGSILKDLETWNVREDDVWNLTYYKAGSTWVQEIISAVMSDGDLEALKKIFAEFRMFFIDINLSEQQRQMKNLPQKHKIAETAPSPRLIKSHLTGPFLPPQLWEKNPKIIYVIRNPKDLMVSMFHFQKMAIPIRQVCEQSFEEFFEEMLQGKAFYGPWWDHYLLFWKRRHQKNILLLRFEDMKRDLRGHVEKISKFLGKDLSSDTLDAITEHCSFGSMKNNSMSNPGIMFDQVAEQRNITSAFMRKGKVGYWKTHFTVAQNEAMDALIKEKLYGTGLTFDYD